MNSVVEKIKEWLPNCVTEFKSKDGKIKLGLNFKILKQEFSDVLIELVRTDKINVVYVLNLLKEINHENKEEMQKKLTLSCVTLTVPITRKCVTSWKL